MKRVKVRECADRPTQIQASAENQVGSGFPPARVGARLGVAPARRALPAALAAAPPPPRAPAPRPKLIHTEETVRPRTKQVRGRRPPRHPADDLRAIRLRSPTPSPSPSPEPSPAPSPQSPPAPSPPSSPLTASTTHEGGPFKCEMCALEFPRRDALLLHVPVHI
ncbi:hypothetical protein MSG28_010187 [Choristoneura fumiferana]|uniref:Uncharacterized protein n=1 Tax=Choristoneura fumiferana TaxID=7141 RepID=A0ACC0KK94_CHOFU|nr:hypothetical protein MSG28_010187 [Choristoneura fumiferana]